MAKPLYQIYLAGGKSDFRKTLSSWSAFDSVDLVDPFTHSRQDAPYQFVNDDLAHIAASDLMLAVVDYHRYTGLAAEVGYAHALGIPVVLVWPGNAGERLDMFIAAMCSFVFVGEDGLAAALTIIQERYLP